MDIAVIGTGYVGLVSGTCFAEMGHEVTCVDIDEEKVAELSSGEVPIYEPDLDRYFRRAREEDRLHFTTDLAEGVTDAKVVFFALPTPKGEDGSADLSYVKQAASDVADLFASDTLEDDIERRIVVNKSTVPVGTGAEVERLFDERGLEHGEEVAVVSNPEFLREGSAVEDFLKPDRVVIGTEVEWAADRMKHLYEPFVRQGNPIFVMDIASAEMVKYASNAMLATKISFINEVANLCESHGCDIEEVRRGMCADLRIGNKFLYPGLGYGGSCFPKDVLACLAMGESTQTPTPLMQAVHDVNQRQRSAFMNKMLEHFGPEGLAGARIAVWGIAFKPGTDDIREAPAVELMRQMLQHGADIIASDPVAHETCYQVLGDQIEYREEPYQALDGADALLVCTDWPEFKHPDFDDIYDRLRQPVIFDGRNLYRPEAMASYGFSYYSVGRPPQQPKATERVEEAGQA